MTERQDDQEAAKELAQALRESVFLILDRLEEIKTALYAGDEVRAALLLQEIRLLHQPFVSEAGELLGTLVRISSTKSR